MSTKQYAGNAILDYGKLTVAKLREELKIRGIPSTGLTRKQHFIDRLVQEDAKNGEDPCLVDPNASVTDSSNEAISGLKHNVEMPTDTNVGDDVVKGAPSAVLQAEQAALAVDPHSATAAIDITSAGESPQEARAVGMEGEPRNDVNVQSPHEDQKRKRQSQSPDGTDNGSAQKKLKRENNEALITNEGNKNKFPTMDLDNSERAQMYDITSRQSIPRVGIDPVAHDFSSSVHPATAALYIRNLKRPLQPSAFRQHLAALARNEHAISLLHLDVIRTHAFVRFSSIEVASHVRLGLHDHVWPAERDRDPLWVDFVPEDKLATWINTEKSADLREHGSPTRRWEIVYDTFEDGSTVATLREVQSYGTALDRSDALVHASSQHTSLDNHKQSEVLTQAIPDQILPNSTSFLALDELFRSTKAKPKLYWVPAESRLVDDRLDEIDALTTKTRIYPRSGSGLNDSRRYTFEDGNRLVDNGPEFGLRGTRSTRGDRGQARGHLRGLIGDHWHS